jgi:hypothetical protein
VGSKSAPTDEKPGDCGDEDPISEPGSLNYRVVKARRLRRERLRLVCVTVGALAVTAAIVAFVLWLVSAGILHSMLPDE